MSCCRSHAAKAIKGVLVLWLLASTGEIGGFLSFPRLLEDSESVRRLAEGPAAPDSSSLLLTRVAAILEQRFTRFFAGSSITLLRCPSTTAERHRGALTFVWGASKACLPQKHLEGGFGVVGHPGHTPAQRADLRACWLTPVPFCYSEVTSHHLRPQASRGVAASLLHSASAGLMRRQDGG